MGGAADRLGVIDRLVAPGDLSGTFQQAQPLSDRGQVPGPDIGQSGVDAFVHGEPFVAGEMTPTM
jgi:hypothetical protein